MPSGGKKGIEFSCEKDKEDDPEQILKALSSLDTPEEKLAALCKKYADLHEEHRLLKNKFKQSQKSLTSLMREKDQLQTEHSKAVLAKSKLESLCRELQRHNKLVKEESLARAREEDEKRKEITTKFQTTITEIQQQMSEHNAKNSKLRDENIELATKLKNLIEQYEMREQQIEKIIKHRDLEQQLQEAKLAQASLMVTEEKEKGLQTKQILLQEAADAHKKIALLEEQEKQLRAQVALYTEKYEEFQQTLAKSNEVFQSFKSEMDKMTKRIKKLEKETVMWRQRWESSNKALLEMAEDKTRADKETTVLQNKITKLENLCRALQQERNKKTPQPAKTTENKSEPPEGKAATETPPNSPSDSRTSPESNIAQAETTSSDSAGEPEKLIDQSEERTQPEGGELENSQSDVVCDESQLSSNPPMVDGAEQSCDQPQSDK